jgi:hypothetical protein
MMMMLMLPRPPPPYHNNNNRDASSYNDEKKEKEQKKEQKERRRAERDFLEGADDGLTLLEASLVGLGGGALWAAGTGKKLLRRTIMSPLLPETVEYACLAGAVTGTLAATGLWVTRRDLRESDALLSALSLGGLRHVL